MASQLNGTIDVTQVFTSSMGGFAALRADGSVVTWGASDAGGDSSAVANQLSSSVVGFADIYSNINLTFDAPPTDTSAPLLNTLSPADNATSMPAASNLSLTFNEAIQAGIGNIAIYNANGSVAKTISVTDSSQVTISGNTLTINPDTDLASGNSYYVNMPTGVIKDLAGNAFSGINDSTTYNFATLLELPITSSTPSFPGHSMGEFKNDCAFAVIKADGSVVTWGKVDRGGDSSMVANQLNGNMSVVQVFSNWGAFAALRVDGSVITWGDLLIGGDSSSVARELNGMIDVMQVFSTQAAFAALCTDGSVVTWGYAGAGGDSSSVASELDGTIDVTQIFSTGFAFAALRANGSLTTWGHSGSGGDSNIVASELDGMIDVTQVFSTNSAFAALRANGSVISA